MSAPYIKDAIAAIVVYTQLPKLSMNDAVAFVQLGEVQEVTREERFALVKDLVGQVAKDASTLKAGPG